jgi:cation diffusion facilitator family transporter
MGKTKTENAEKRRVTLLSLATAIVLIIVKVAVGLKTGYLTLITEAVHSMLDALVTVITFFSIRYAERPADSDHPYGHEKAENLAAFAECMLLFVALGLIVDQLVRRLFFETPHLAPSLWPVIVLVISMIFDLNRAHALKKVARAYKSPAIEADAVHFSADLMTSGIALCGMGLAYILSKFIDSASWFVDIATTAVVILTVARMVVRILLRSSQVLLDRTAPGQRELIRRVVSRIPDVIGVEAIRTREAGKKTFVELTLAVDRNLTVESSCRIQQSAEAAIKRHVDNADVVLQLRPEAKAPEDIVERVRAIGARHGRNIHHITVHDIRSVLHVDMDLEVDGEMKLGDAHALAELLETKIKEDNPLISEVNTHIEWRKQSPVEGKVVTERDALIRIIERTVKGKQGVLDCGRVVIEEEESGDIVITVSCTMRPEEKGADVQRISEEIERSIRESIKESSRVVVHVEPERTA